jgi:hypothetical protein
MLMIPAATGFFLEAHSRRMDLHGLSQEKQVAAHSRLTQLAAAE